MKKLLFGGTSAAILALPFTLPAFASPPTLSFEVTKLGAPQVLADIEVMFTETANFACSATCACARTHTAMLLTARGLVEQMNIGEIASTDMVMALNVADDDTLLLEVVVDGVAEYVAIDDELLAAASLRMANVDIDSTFDAVSGDFGSVTINPGLLNASAARMASTDILGYANDDMSEPARITRYLPAGFGHSLMRKIRVFTQNASGRMTRFVTAQAEGMSMQPV